MTATAQNHQGPSGFILVVSMLLMAAFSLLILNTLHRIACTMRLNEQLNAKHHALYNLEDTARYLQSNLPAISKGCLMSEQKISNLFFDDLRLQGCTMKYGAANYHYLFADLGVFPCLMIATPGGHRSSHHWSVILAKEGLEGMVMRLRVAVPESISVCSMKMGQTLYSNLLSWQIQLSK